MINALIEELLAVWYPRGRTPAPPLPDDIAARTDVSRQRRWQMARQREGRCVVCAKPRQRFAQRCDACQAKQAALVGIRDLGRYKRMAVLREQLRALLPGETMTFPPGPERPRPSFFYQARRKHGINCKLRGAGKPGSWTVIRLPDHVQPT